MMIRKRRRVLLLGLTRRLTPVYIDCGPARRGSHGDRHDRKGGNHGSKGKADAPRRR